MSHRVLIIIEKTSRHYSAYSLDLPGCVATGKSRRGVEVRMREAIDLHLRGMKEDGLPIPKLASTAEFVTVR